MALFMRISSFQVSLVRRITSRGRANIDNDSVEGRNRADEALNYLVAARRARILGISFLAGLGAALVVSGLVVNAWAVRTMVRGGASPDALRPSEALVTWGLFRFTRNPMYLGFVLIYAGGGLLLNSLWIVLLAGVIVSGVTKAIIVRDEHLLEKRFGDEYRTYRARVRRWL